MLMCCNWSGWDHIANSASDLPMPECCLKTQAIRCRLVLPLPLVVKKE